MRFVLLALVVLTVVFPALAELKTERVILLTVDGLRHEELFGGLDPMLVDEEAKEQSGIKSLDVLKEKYWRETPEERREVLFPFFWKEMSQRGIIVGNPAKNSSVVCENVHYFSYPGYAEILTGAYQPRVWSNGKFPSPVPTVLEFAQQELDLGYTGVGAVCSWEVFNWICAKKEDAFFINAGYEAVPDEWATPGMEPLNSLQFEMLTPWDSVRFDEVTKTIAFEFLKKYEPKALYLALGETDDWAHNRRYDRVINGCRLFDDTLRELWALLQSLDAYKDNTTILITSDHGRGHTLEDWTSHGRNEPGSENIWFAVFGPDTPNRGELSDTKQYTQGQMAATLAKFLGLDYNAFYEDATEPIDIAFE